MDPVQIWERNRAEALSPQIQELYDILDVMSGEGLLTDQESSTRKAQTTTSPLTSLVVGESLLILSLGA